MRRRFHVSALALGALVLSCSSCSKAQTPRGPSGPSANASASDVAMVTPSRLLPDLVGTRGTVATEEGHRRVLIDRMRLFARTDGSIERAAELLPRGSVHSIALPSRLGGGYLFHVNAGGGTEIWRASSWLGKLRPLTRRSQVISEIVPGFDRLYVRLSSGHRLIAIHPDTGESLPLGPLPMSGTYGRLAFADGWRAIVDTDLRGPLATFDAGTTWRPLDIGEKPKGVDIFGGDPAVIVGSGHYVVDARGFVTHRTDKAPHRAHDDSALAKRSGPLGKRPLRAAVEDGWPDSATTALVARGGALARVSLKDGVVVAIAEDAYPDARAACHAIRLGPKGLGFLCGERDGATTVYEHVPPLAMRPVLRFDKPRFIASNGNGGLTIRGRCKGDVASLDEADARWYCVRSPAGATREIRIKGFDLGVERVIGLADGRVAVIVPPRGGSAGDLSIVAVDGRATKVPLAMSDARPEALRELKRGLWLDGFEERSPGVLGGWVEAGGPVLGIEIKLDGKVKAGELQADASGAILGGRFGVVMLDSARALQTTDGGMTYKGFDLPSRDDEARAVPARAAGPVGAALPGWVRVGWGDPATKDDMKPAETPSSPYTPLTVSPTIALTCDVASVATPPLPDKPKAAKVPPPHIARPHHRLGSILGRYTYRSTAIRYGGPSWLTFRNTAAPALGADEIGFDHGTGDGAPLRAYAWGKRGADWSRAGRWMIRFDDAFDVAGGVRSTALGASLWADEATAAQAIGGSSSYGSIHWAGFLEPSGRSLLAAACHGGGSSCALYAASEGQPVLPLRDGAGRTGHFVRPFPDAAVRVGDTWFFLAQSSSYDAVALWRVDLGVARQIGTYYRPVHRYGHEAPRLVRRALGGGVGILVGGQPEPGEPSGSWYVLPVDPETGALGEPSAIARRDLSTTPLSRCAAEQDGWVMEVSPRIIVDLTNARGLVDHIEARVRLDPGRACVEAFSGRTSALYPREAGSKALTSAPGRRGGGDVGALMPLAVNERTSGRRWGLTCRVGKQPLPSNEPLKPAAPKRR